jgi:hypothetical protein
MTDYRNLTSDEVFFILREEHRLCSPLDHEANPSFDLQPSTTIADWIDARDLLRWHKLAKVYNDEFKIDVDLESWKGVFAPSNKKTVKDVCDLIASHAKIEVIKPVKVFGQTCISAAIFKSIKKNLESRGIDTSDIGPSSEIEPVLKKHFGVFVGHINKNFAGVIPEIRKQRTSLERISGYFFLIFITSLIGGIFWNPLLNVSVPTFIIGAILWFIDYKLFNYRRGMLTIPGIVTFRDLVDKIVESKYASQQKL